MKKNKAFTLIELIAVLVILAIISLIVAPLILNIIRRVKDVANKRSVDGYGRAVEYAMASYQLEHLAYPDTFDKLEIEYKGNKVECKTNRINPDYSIYLSECKVNGRLVKNDKEIDGFYHYGILKMTNQEYVDTYGKNLEEALKFYYDEYNEYPSDYTTLTLPPLDKEVSCDVETYSDGKIFLTKCSVDSEEVLDENQDDGYYHYRETRNAVKYLLKKTNSKLITTYTDGNTHEMYTFDHEATEQTPVLTDYRYIGNVPYNYVKFNGNEIWRIVGVFDTDDGYGKYDKRIKLLKSTSFRATWDSNSKYDWAISTLNSYLNDNYYNQIFELDRNIIDPVKYYLGQWSYESERGKSGIPGASDNWTGKIALIYPSDYIYTFSLGVEDYCFNNIFACRKPKGKNPSNSWIYMLQNGSSYYWTISACSNYTIYNMLPDGALSSFRGSQNFDAALPTLYLKPEVKIKSGDGTIDNPYEFEL